MSLAGATVTSIYKYNMNITLTAQRTKIIAMSGTPGGDNASSVGNFLPGFVLDRSGLPLQYVVGLSILEFADTIIPNITRVVLDLNDGKVSIFVEEFVDATPGSNIEFSKISFANVSGDKAVPMDHTTSVRMENGDDAVLVVQLSERQRANVIAISGQRGGDNTAAILDVADGAFHDIAKNGVVNTSIVAEEIPDTTPPVLRRVEYNYMTGILTFVCSEIIDLTPTSRVDFSKFRIYDWKGGAVTDMRIENGTLNQTDNATFQIKLQPYQRWATLDVGDFAHARSLLGEEVPDIPLLIDVEEGAFTDVALNNVNETKTNVTDPTKSFVLRFITESIVYEGSPTVAVVNYTKDWYFNGSGVDKVPGILIQQNGFQTLLSISLNVVHLQTDILHEDNRRPTATAGGAFRVVPPGSR